MQDNHVAFVDVLSCIMDTWGDRCASYRRPRIDLARINRGKKGRSSGRLWIRRGLREMEGDALHAVVGRCNCGLRQNSHILMGHLGVGGRGLSTWLGVTAQDNGYKTPGISDSGHVRRKTTVCISKSWTAWYRIVAEPLQKWKIPYPCKQKIGA